MLSKYISKTQDISRLKSIFQEETKDGNDRVFIICPRQYVKQNPTAITYYLHPDSVDELIKDGYFRELDSWPSLDSRVAGMAGPYVYKVLAHANKFREGANESQPTTNGSKETIKRKPPESWKLEPHSNEVYLKKDGQLVFTFKTNWSNKYRYFCCLWNYYAQQVSYKEIYEYKSKSKYPDKQVSKTNSNIRRELNKLSREINSEFVSIDINKGAKLTLAG